MQNRTALIVDDSRTASQMLRLMLEREEFQVDVLGCAEDALGYLRDHRPGIIFMDHLMPGMDGFQAVKEIKSASATATIPIVMYTANSGELYVGQAHALGAADILPKPPTRDALRAVFRRIDEREEAANEPVAESAAAEEDNVPTVVAEPSVLGDLDTLEGGEATPIRAPEKLAPQTPDYIRAASAPDADADTSGGGRASWWLVLALGAAAFFAGTQFRFPSTQQPESQLDSLAWAVGEAMTFDYGEVPFSGRRVDTVRGLIERLSAAGFRGTVRLQANVGTFCLVAETGGWKLPAADMPISDCDTIGPSGQEARQMSGSQSAEFRELLRSGAGNRNIKVVVEALGDRRPVQPYPEQSQVKSAGDWNRIAAQNNRIKVSLEPAP